MDEYGPVQPYHPYEETAPVEECFDCGEPLDRDGWCQRCLADEWADKLVYTGAFDGTSVVSDADPGL